MDTSRTSRTDDLAPDLTAQDLDVDLDELGSQTALGTWGSAGTFSSASCPASTASTGGSASSAG